MHKFAPVVLLVLAACGGADSRVDECTVDGCDQAVQDACVSSVEACETAGGPLEGTCIDAVIAANDISCAAGT